MLFEQNDPDEREKRTQVTSLFFNIECLPVLAVPFGLFCGSASCLFTSLWTAQSTVLMVNSSSAENSETKVDCE